MVWINHYFEQNGIDTIFKIRYDPKSDIAKLIIRQVYDNEKGETIVRTIKLSDAGVRCIISLYNQLKFGTRTKLSVYDELMNMREKIIEIQEKQTELKLNPDGVINTQFSLIIHELESLAEKFGGE